MVKIFLNILLLLFAHQYVFCQDTIPAARRDSAEQVTEEVPILPDTLQFNDTIVKKTSSGKDTVIVKKKVHSPRRATLRSLIIPGWGQIYNRKYWKVPIVYAGIGIPVYLFFDNKRWYDRTRYALSLVANGLTQDSASLAKVHPQLLTLVTSANSEGSLINYRNEFRRDMDYSILFTLLMWGLNVADATVDAHLMGFDVSDDLAMKIRPTLMNGSMTPGISVVLNFK